MIKVSIDVTKIPRERIIPASKPSKDGHTAKYVSFVLWENKGGTDQYGNDGFVSIDVSKAEREAGKKGVIVGNWKDTAKASRPKPQAPAARQDNNEPDDFNW